ncbi:DNA methyltransferase [uncultured Selenomonas sp.]|uniref:class I SAM-dependent DNA methyltransferase n=1 Tax=uncultured Selenomonas sp. TaxID=159275 RepID=UPI0025D4AB8C|nr:DNA methyltransferase [uncultured Selenomonas sp.]
MFDPACGSGNFLTESYLSLRRLENDILRELIQTQRARGGGGNIALDFAFEDAKENAVQVMIGQFYGIEVNDFAVAVAKTALWIAESQMFEETQEILSSEAEFLPLTANCNIHEGNALRMDWKDVLAPDDSVKIMGNPPFNGAKLMLPKQKDDILSIFVGTQNAGSLDYVAGWYKKAADYMKGTQIHAAFVSTNSITQGEQVPILWKPLMEKELNIDFAYKTFIWDSDAVQKAHVHCVIVGFSYAPPNERRLFDEKGAEACPHINAYLMPAPDLFVERRKEPICDVPSLILGNMTYDDGNLILSEEEKDALVKAEPITGQWIRPFYGSHDFLHRQPRYVIWLQHVAPSEIRKSKAVTERVQSVYEFRKNAKRAGTRKGADYPTIFLNITQQDDAYENFIFVPRVSSQRRRYIPMGFLPASNMISDAAYFLPFANLYIFGVLESNVHMSWMRTFAGRLKSDYRYSNFIVYNNFPWPTPTPTQRAKIERTAQGILDARALYPGSSLADLYDEVLMPKELREAHRANDRAVMDAYGFWGKIHDEPACVAALMRMYQQLTAK